jgi:tRNA threonylcarbamoyladenosine biosynthesis protein TsaE
VSTFDRLSGARSGQSQALPFESRGPEDTRRLGERLGQAAQPGDVILLSGVFGAGKTVLVQGIASGLQVPTTVTSPSFVLATEHHGRLPLYHVDLFRLESLEDELLAGLIDYMEGEGVCAIEWPERLPLPTGLSATRIEIRPLDANVRLLRITPAEARVAEAVEQARRDLETMGRGVDELEP